jgi:hypothetical protein
MKRREQLRGRVAVLLEERSRLSEVLRVSLERDHELFEEWKNDPMSILKKAIWEKQRQISKQAAAKLEKAKANYLEAARKLR